MFKDDFFLSDTPRDEITLDIHFQRSNIVIYRTDLLYSWIDLLVGFGGIFGLFLGASIISAIEFVFFLLMGIFIALKRFVSKFKEK